MIRQLIIAVLICGVIVFSFFEFYHFLKKRIVTSDLKAATEKRISAFLKTPVRVDRISVGLLKHISLSGLEIKRTENGRNFLIGVKKIVVRYDLLSFLKRNFRIPTEVLLDTPRLTVQAFQNPGALFDLALLKSDHGILTRFEFDEGEIKLPWIRKGESIHLTGIEGRALPKKGEVFDVRFKSRLSGIVSGSLLAYGEIDPSKKSSHLELVLDQVSFSKASQVPISELNGTLELENDTVRFRNLHLRFRGIPCELSGEIRHAFSARPLFAISAVVREGKFTFRSDLRADFEEGVLSGDLRLGDKKYQFTGSILGEPKSFKVPRLILNEAFRGSGTFDLETGIFRLGLEHEDQRFQCQISIADFNWRLAFKLDHFALYGFDLVTAATVDLRPHEEAWQKGIRLFDVKLTTDYLVFQYQPLRDFKATAQLSRDGLDQILARWGNVSELRGRIEFGQVPEVDLTIGVGPISFSELDSLGVHPLPVSLEGTFSGRLQAKGPMNGPSLNGDFTIEKGTAGSLQYDRALVHFSGSLPYLLLHDSKIWIGKNSFLLKGGLDFTLRNFLRGIKVGNSENIIIWRGLELSSELDRRTVESNYLRSSDRNRRGKSTIEDAPVAKVEAEYQFGDRTSLEVTAEEDRAKKEYLTVGPKVKF